MWRWLYDGWKTINRQKQTIEKNRYEYLNSKNTSKTKVYNESKDTKLQAGRADAREMACNIRDSESLTCTRWI